jgi:hypothetical protein
LRVALDELPAVKVWGLRAAGLIGRGTRSVVIEAGDSFLTVAVEETPMKNGGAYWHFRCPGCGRRAKVLRLLGERAVCFRCCAATGLWYRRLVNEAGQRALIAHKRMNWFANPPRTPERYRNPRGFRKKEVKLQAALVALGKATRLKE